MDYMTPQVLALRQIPMPQGTTPYTAMPQQGIQYTTHPTLGAPGVADARLSRPGTTGVHPMFARAGGTAKTNSGVARDNGVASTAVPISNENFPYTPQPVPGANYVPLPNTGMPNAGMPQAGGPLVDRNGNPIVALPPQVRALRDFSPSNMGYTPFTIGDGINRQVNQP